MEAKVFISKSSNILSVAILLVGLTTFGAGVYITETNAQDMQKERELKNQQIERLEGALGKESDYKQIYMDKVEEQLNQIHSLEKENNDLKKKVETYKNKSESPSVSIIPSRGEKAKRQVRVVATAYTARCNGCSGITSTGINVKNKTHHNGVRIIATDPNVIPTHSKVRVDVSNGDSFYAIAEDKGGAIKGGRIDVLVSTNREAINFGRQQATITILD